MEDTLTSLYSRISGDPYGMWAVLIELLLIGLCVNWCAGVLHGTRGTRPLRGVLIMLVVATLVVRAFGWVRLDLLYSYVLFGLAFLGLVVFQPELRRAVIRAGDVRFRKRGGSHLQVVSALVKSAGYLSRNRHGAVVAIQRKVDLSGWAENGTMMRAEVSASLLNNIFFPNSPLHDLGVIIRGSRIQAANCQFPSADSDEIDAALGSRHLAAVGMSYETDALVLVISEETGVVSLADNGKLTRYVSLDDLTDELTERLAGRPATAREPGKQKRRGSAAWGIVRRLLVVAPLTAVIWYLADQATLVQSSARVQLGVRHVDRRCDVQPDEFDFTVMFSGSVRAMDELAANATEGPLKLNWTLSDDYTAGTYTLGAEQIRSTVENLPERAIRGLGVVGLVPHDLRISFAVDERVSLAVRVEPDTRPDSIEIQRIEPPEVEVVLRAGDVPADRHRFGGVVRAVLSEHLEHLVPGDVRTFEHVRLDELVHSPLQPAPLRPLEMNPTEVQITVRVVGQRMEIHNVVVRLFVSPLVLERYDVEKSDLNEWRISFDVVVGTESAREPLAAHSFDAFVHITNDMLPPAGEPPQAQLRTVDVTILPKVKGVSVVGKRTVRINLVPRRGGPP